MLTKSIKEIFGKRKYEVKNMRKKPMTDPSDKSIKEYISNHPRTALGLNLTVGTLKGMGYSDRGIEHYFGIESPSKPYVDPRFYDKEGNLSPSREMHYQGVDAMNELRKGMKG